MYSKTLRASSMAMNCGVGSNAGDQPEYPRLDHVGCSWPKRMVPRTPPCSIRSTDGNWSKVNAVNLANGAERRMRMRLSVTAYVMPLRAQASTRKRPTTRYKPASRNGIPHSFMNVGEFGAPRTPDSQKTAKPANIRLNGTINQSLLVNSNPWPGCPHQTIFSPFRRRPWNVSVCMRRVVQRCTAPANQHRHRGETS